MAVEALPLCKVRDPGGGVCQRLPDLDVERLEAIRAQLPILSARRTDLYEVREK